MCSVFGQAKITELGASHKESFTKKRVTRAFGIAVITGLPCSLSKGKQEFIVKDAGERRLIVTQEVK